MLAERHAAGGGDRFLPEVHNVADAGELAPLLGDERAGAGAARLVHGAVHDPALGEPDVFGVLPADLENGVDPRIEVNRAGGVSRDLVQDIDRVPAVAGGEQGTDNLAAAAGHGAGEHALAGQGAGDELLHQRLRGAHRIAQGLTVALPPEFAGAGVERHGFRAGRADVEAKDEVAGPGLHGCGRRWRQAAHMGQKRRQRGQ